MVTPDDIRVSATACRTALQPHAGADWERIAGDLEWTCRFTLAHTGSALMYYAVNLATRSTESRPSGQVDPGVEVPDLLDALEGRGFVLAEVVAASPPDARGYHSAGMADPSGYAAMGCDELLLHTNDIATGLGIEFDPPREVCARVLARLFPWAPSDGDPWEGLLWANGRAALGDRKRLDPSWTWHCAPLDEWDGTDPTTK